MRCDEAQELITALVDNELSAPERSSIESHLKDCPKCQMIYEEELTLKRELHVAGTRMSAPADLRRKLLADERLFPQPFESPGGWERLLSPLRSALRPAFVLALLVLLALPALHLMQPKEQSVSLSALETHGKILQGAISFVRAESQEAVKEHLEQSVSGTFAPMGYDFSMMQLKAVGGRVHGIDGRKVLVTIYEGAFPSLTCYTFLGTEEDAPAGALLLFDPEKKINFYTFSRGGINGVLHREGKLICILVSKAPMEQLLALARAKARPS